MNRYLHLLIALAVSFLSFSQTDSTSSQGSIVSGEIVIEKEKKITLPVIDKLYEKAELNSFSNDPLRIQLSTFEPQLNWPPYKSDVSFIQIKEDYPSNEYPNYIKAGYGNFGSPLLELGVFKKLGSFDTKSRVFYERFGSGPVNGQNSGNSIGRIDLSATYRKKTFFLKPQLDFANRTYRFYGNTDQVNTGFNSERSPKVKWNDLNIGFSVGSSSKDIQYSITPMYAHNTQSLDGSGDLNKESVFSARGDLNYDINETFSTGFDIEGYSGKYESGISYDRALFQLRPWVRYKKDELTLNAGINISSSKSGDEKDSGIYPVVEGKWEFNEKWALYGKLSGGIQWNGLGEMLETTEFLDDSLVALNTEYKSEFGGGIKGSPMKNMIIDLSITIANLENLPIIIPSASDSSRYSLTYDGRSIDRVRFKSSLTYSPTNVSTYGASLQLDGYSVETLDRPWHLPTYTFEAYTSHNINEKLIASARVISMGGIKAPANVNFGILNLDSFIDVGFDVKYLFNERVSGFIDVDNLLSSEYERYIGYPVRGLTFKIGGQYRF